MVDLNNLIGYCLSTPVRADNTPEGVSSVIGKPRLHWSAEFPLVIYETPQQLIENTPGYSKKTHFINQVIIHVLGERVEVIGS